MKKYVTSNTPRLAHTGDYIQIVKNKIRQPVKTWKTVLKIQQATRKVKVK